MTDAPMSMIVTCRTCGADYEATSAMIAASTWKRACPVCHPPRDEEQELAS